MMVEHSVQKVIDTLMDKKKSDGGTLFSKLDNQTYEELVEEVNSIVGKQDKEIQEQLKIECDPVQEKVFLGLA